MDYKLIDSLKNIHIGQDIWILAPGPSMNYIDKTFFNNKITIGHNDIYKLFPCNYVVMKDCMEQPRFPRSIMRLNQLNIPLIFSEYNGGRSTNEKNSVQHNNAYMFKHNPKIKDFKTELAEKTEDQIIVGKSTIVSILHIACLMGASNIIVCGNESCIIDDQMYVNGYVEPDWVSASNYTGIHTHLRRASSEYIIARDYLRDKYNVNIYSLNPFADFNLETHKYEILS
jgi:hypothetical protein